MAAIPKTGREIRLGARPDGMPKESDFELVETPIAEPADGEILVRNVYMSVDPYMRGRMNDVRSYVPPFAIGETLQGGAVGQVVLSRSSRFSVGDCVSGMLGWREYYLSDGSGLGAVDPRLAPLSAYLGALGMPGLTAYVGLLDLGQPKQGETVFVSTAAGAVGSLVGQLAKLRGCRAVGSTGSEEKVRILLDEFGFDEAFDYKKEEMGAALDRTCPDGIDVYFENVGGEHLAAVLPRMRPFGRIPVCGMISQYNTAPEHLPAGPNLVPLLINRVTMRGFMVSDHFDRLNDFLRDMSGWLSDGKIRTKETVVEGIESAPRAFIGLLEGRNIGKMLVKLGPEPEQT